MSQAQSLIQLTEFLEKKYHKFFSTFYFDFLFYFFTFFDFSTASSAFQKMVAFAFVVKIFWSTIEEN